MVFIIDIIYSKPEKRERWPMIDPNSTIRNTGYDAKLFELLDGKWTPPVPPAPAGGVPAGAAKTDHALYLRGDPRDAKNTTEGGPITLTKLRVHAVMRLFIWAAVAIVAGAVGTALWLTKDNKNIKNLAALVQTGIVVQLVGVAVIVVGPT